MIDLCVSDESHVQHEDSSDQDLDEEHRIGGLGIVSPGMVYETCLLYTSPSPRDYAASRMPSSA